MLFFVTGGGGGCTRRKWVGGERKNSVARERGGMTKVEKGRISKITHIVFFSYPLSDNLV